MKQMQSVTIFGYGKFGNSIAKSIKNEVDTYVKVAVTEDEEFDLATLEGFDVVKFNIESDQSILNLNLLEETRLICTMDNNHDNLFLALTLRSLYKENYILAISDSIRMSDKLRMAGVNRVIDIYQISSNMIINILEKPIATKFLQGFVNKEHNYIFKEIVVQNNSKVNGKYLSEIDFNAYDIIFIGMVDKKMGEKFIFSTVVLDHKIDTEDIVGECTFSCIFSKK